MYFSSIKRRVSFTLFTGESASNLHHMGQTSHFHVNTDFSYKLIVDFGGRLPYVLAILIVHSLSSGKVAATPILKSVHRNFRLLFSKLQSRGTLTRQFSSKVAHKDGDKEKITAIYCLWMVDNKRGREW